MLPTLSPEGDWVLYNRLPFFFPSASPSATLRRPFQRGDMVIALHPLMPDRTVGKRIIGVAGDRVEVNPGGARKGLSGSERGKYIKVPRGHVWLQGDNLSNSTDSRDYGPVPSALILARVEARVRLPSSPCHLSR